RVADDAAREQVGVAVVVEGDDLRRRAGCALEGDVQGRRILLPAVPRAEAIFHRPGAATRLVPRIPALRGRWRDLPVRLRQGYRLDFSPEQRHADHADVVRAPGARRV